ncbi:cobalamin-dependent protein [Streptomyces sp. NPDC002812]|uniref:cobalamin B12-binding domain-containing protein n=1 Tax=unclassified Streptomyces TaxID=2593676 RepID=UPI00331F5500
MLNRVTRVHPARNAPTAVVGTVPSDSHTWNLVFLQLLLEEHGYHVHNLGPCTPHEELAAACADLAPDLLVLSSVNGHGVIEGPRSIQAVRARSGQAGPSSVIGGMLTTNGQLTEGQTTALLEAGFDAVFTTDQSVHAFSEYLRRQALEATREPVVSGAVR